jgi:catechol 2,3-dioxygenase-like lactoylglutathione lyase family enzyme
VIRGVQHVALEVDDLDAALSFYQGVLGLQLAPRPEALGPNGAWIDTGVGQIHLTAVDPYVATTSSQHLALEVDDIEVAVARLREAGVEVSDWFDLGAGRQAFLRDPAGNLLEINQPS